MHHFGNEGQRPHRAGAHARNQEKLGEIGGTPLGGRGHVAVKAMHHDIAFADIMVSRHDQMRQQWLHRGRCGAGLQGGEFSKDAIRPKILEQVKLSLARGLGAPVGQVDDLALVGAFDGRMRLVDETLQTFGQPMIAARHLAVTVHALLHHHPVAVVGDDEAMQIEVETVLDGGAVHLGDQPAGGCQARAVEADALTDGGKLMRGFARMRATAAADVNAEFAR